MTDGIVEFIEEQLAEVEERATYAQTVISGRWDGWEPIAHQLAADCDTVPNVGRLDQHLHHNADPAHVLAQVAFMRRIVELHTTGVYRTYQCSNGDHIQEWQCERANEPYTEHRYCEVCGNECVEVPLLAEIWAGRPGYKPEWRLS